MRYPIGKITFLFGATALFILGASLGSCGCGGDASTTDGSDTTAIGSGSTNATSADGAGGTTDNNASGNGTDTVGRMDTRTTDRGATVTLTPAEERTKTGDEMRGLRAVLKAELDGVRARLGKTTDAAAKEADKVRAAELAQGLERIDRAIKAIDEADDVSWGTIRESQLKEAGEVRAWMAKYGMNVSA